MRLSTEAHRDDARSRGVIDAAIAAGITLFDTADAYAHDDTDVGHNERLLAPIARMARVVTKGGLIRPGGAWVPDGRARHLAGAARASRERLGVPVIDTYVLHAVDPKVSLATSVRALARLQADGIVAHLGLSNISRAQLEDARRIATISAVEVELNPWRMDAVHGGLVAACRDAGITVLAHRPLGGPAGVRRATKELGSTAAELGITACELVLAWLQTLAPVVVPIPGATRVETVASIARAGSVVVPAGVVDELNRRYLAIGKATPRANRADDAEVVVIIGMPGAGKSTLANDYLARGFVRLNRDERGGTLADIAEALDEALAAGATRLVVDNTYGTRAQRARVIEIARRHGAAIHGVIMQTSLEDAQTNAAARMLALRGRLLEPAELVRDREMIGPSAQFRFRRSYEAPAVDEGFTSLVEQPFVRTHTGAHAGVIVELDHLVWRGRPMRPETIRLDDAAIAKLAPWSVIAGTTWQVGQSADAIAALADRLRTMTGLAIEVAACTHPAGPPVCWCRKPLPGLGLVLARRLDLDLARSVHLGRGPADRGFAARLGMSYVDVGDQSTSGSGGIGGTSR